MIPSTIQMRRLTPDDFEAFKQMQTGIENDYIARIFPYSVKEEATYGVFIGDQLVSLAAYTIFAGRYAVLGRLRTDLRFRGRGLATQLLAKLCRELDNRHPEIVWIGLATELSNHPVQHIAHRLGMKRLSAYYSCVLENSWEEMKGLVHGAAEEWEAVIGHNEKYELLKSVGFKDNPLHIFPYECYYSLPYEEALWSENYLSGCSFWRRGADFFALMEDTKGSPYLHVKYFGENSFAQPGLWARIITEARKTDRSIWVDLPYQKGLPEETASFSSRVPWTCYGRISQQTS
ncbi:MAG TPA: GNAT family N-acetyltransferase [Bacillales bacterium]